MGVLNCKVKMICLLFFLQEISLAAPVRVLLDEPPLNFNPRSTIDANGQKINALLYRGLTRIDPDLKLIPDLASEWVATLTGWKFRILDGQKDHADRPITPEKVFQCLENYRAGKPTSTVVAGFPYWKATRLEGEWVHFVLSQMDYFVPRNSSLLRYFTDSTGSACPTAVEGTVVGSGPYQMAVPLRFGVRVEQNLLLRSRVSTLSDLNFFFVTEATTRALKILRGDVDVAINPFEPAKENWFLQAHADKFHFAQRPGATFAYLAFNLKDPLLSRLEVRKAITLAIDRRKITEQKFFRICTVHGSFLNLEVPGSLDFPFEYDPGKAEALLDGAGLPRKKDGTRFTLKYFTTTKREAYEQGLIFKNMLEKIGIHLDVLVHEPSIYFDRLKNGNFQLYASRWVGASDASIFVTALRTGQPRNRVKYSDPEMDRLLDALSSETSEERRLSLMRAVQEKMGRDLPYFPLWIWNNWLIMRKGFVGLEAKDLAINGALLPLGKIHVAP